MGGLLCPRLWDHIVWRVCHYFLVNQRETLGLFVLRMSDCSCNSGARTSRARWKTRRLGLHSGYAAAVLERPRFNWLHTSGLSALGDYKGHRWEWGSGVQWLASDPVHSLTRQSYRGADAQVISSLVWMFSSAGLRYEQWHPEHLV